MGTLTRVRGRIDKQGRLVIPAEIRRELGIGPGEVVTLLVEDGDLKVRTVAAGIRRAQALAATITRGRTGLVDEFIAERRREAARE